MKKRKRSGKRFPKLMPPDMGPPPMAGPPMGGAPPGMGMKKGGRVESRGNGKAQKGRAGTEIIKMAKGGHVRGGGIAQKGIGRGKMC